MDVKVLSSRIPKIPAPIQGLLPALVCLVTGLADRVYIDIDNYWIGIVANNLFAPHSFNQYIHPLLSMATTGLGGLYPAADWFAVLTRVGIVLAMWWLGVLVARCTHGKTSHLFSFLLLIFALYSHTLFNKNYTIISTLFAVIGSVTLLLALRTPLGSSAPWMGALFLAMGFLWRDKSAFLVLPFLLLDLVCLVLARRVTLRRMLRVLLPGLAAVVFLVGFSILFYRLPTYADGKNYDNARITLNDFTTLPWEEIEVPLTAAGLSENDYRCLTTAILVDPDVFGSSLVRKTATVAQKSIAVPSAGEFSAIRQEFADAFTGSSQLRFTTWVCLGLLLLLLCRAPQPLAVAEALCALGGAGLIFLYFACAGRVRDRVILCLMYCLLGVLTLLLQDAQPRKEIAAIWLRRIGCAGLAGVCLYTAITMHYGIFQVALTARRGAEDTSAELTNYTEDALYIWNPMALDLYMTDHYMESGKLPPPAFLERNIPYGEWITGQPYFNTMLTRIGVENPMRALSERPNTFLIANRPDLIQTFLQEHYDSRLTLQQVGTQEVFAMDGVPVWISKNTAKE